MSVLWTPAYIAIGSNLDDPAAQVRSALRHLAAIDRTRLIISSRLYRTVPLGPRDQHLDRALGGALASSRQQYANGLAALDRYAQSSRGKGFLQLTPIEKDSLLMDVESGSVGPGIFSGSSAQFFGMVLGHTRQGMFGDPFYGGNVNYAGWDLLRYPGVRTNVSAADQKALEANTLQANHRSAYDTQMFNKATASHDHDHDMNQRGDRAHGH